MSARTSRHGKSSSSKSSKSTKSSKSNAPSAWSDYSWNSERDCWYRTRTSTNGNIEYEYDYPAQPNTQRSLRSTIDADESNGYSSQVQHEQYSTTASQQPSYQASKSTVYPDYQKNSSNSYAAVPSVGNVQSSTGTTSFQPTYPSTQPTPVSTNGYNYATSYTGVDGVAGQLAKVSISEPQPTPSQGNVSGHVKADLSEWDSRLSIIKDPSRFFKTGRVFLTRWSEPAGNADRYGMIFLEDRRFVVVKNYHGHCTCLALHTYNGQGTTKPGVHAQDHAAAYAVGSKLKLKTGEKMDKEPFRIKVEDSKEKIDPMTRINFSKLYTVEHNVRVMKVGRIVDDDLPRLKKYSVSCLSGNNSDPEPAGGTNSRSQEQGQIGQAGPQPMQYPAYSASSAFGSNGSASYTGTPGPVQPPISNWSYSNASSLNQSMVDTGPYPVSDSSLPSYLNAGYTAASYVPPQTTSYKGSAPTYGSRRQSYRDRDNMYDPDL